MEETVIGTKGGGITALQANGKAVIDNFIAQSALISSR